ncbi:uncharacterized protein LOC135385313 isoform X2 [Ornithodoros turicata]|uniref:uncharacterized protein LOC135385313 isoform X2 n=1 Tax=Ornithodoros turicata TaxID=34597 RepID=UPI0031394743
MFLPWFLLVTDICILGLGSVSAETLCAFARHATVRQSKAETTVNGQNIADVEWGPGAHDALTSMPAAELVDNSTERCPKDSDYCYSLWLEDGPNRTTISILTQGCWGASGEADCKSDACISTKKPSKALNNTRFCCCSGNFCNVNVTDGYIPEEEDTTIAYLQRFTEEEDYKTIIICSVLGVLAVFGFGVCMAYRYFVPREKHGADSVHLMEAPQPPSPAFDPECLKIQETIGRGRYGSVCKGSLNDHTVAVKIFAQHHYQYYLNERDIYKLSSMDHPSLPKLIGSDERIGPDGRREWLLVITHAPCGSLQEYLRRSCIDWNALCKMTQSITKGLAFLHTEGKNKPCIAHRDLTSQNILVKEDGSCMICDFGFAIRISGSRYVVNGEEQHAETTSLADVGTLRYMAPEVLEGAVNLRDCESSLKQVDVYALGLVFWEIATRCSDLYQGMGVPDYKMPFEVEVGVHPSTEQMQVLVARHKARPLFPDIWKDSNQAVRALKETIEDCWDQDAEARLTAVCVEERLNELPILWERHKAGISVSAVSPTVNPTSTHLRGFSLLPQLADTDHTLCNSHARNSTTESEHTGETLLSPSSPGITQPPKNNAAAISNYPIPLVPLQPHQGRNPCMERNLMMESSEEMSISGNTLLGNNCKDIVFRDSQPFESPLSDGLEGSALISADVLNRSARTYHPIPYVQNAVHVSGTIPKQPNVPGNGHKVLGGEPRPEKRRDRLFGGMFQRDRSAEGGIRKGIKSLFEKKGKSSNCSNVYRNTKVTSNAANDTDCRAALLGKCNDGKFPMNTEVQIVNGSCQVRPVHLQHSTVKGSQAPLRGKDINDNCKGAEERVLRPTTLPLCAYIQSTKAATSMEAPQSERSTDGGDEHTCTEPRQQVQEPGTVEVGECADATGQVTSSRPLQRDSVSVCGSVDSSTQQICVEEA